MVYMLVDHDRIDPSKTQYPWSKLKIDFTKGKEMIQYTSLAFKDVMISRMIGDMEEEWFAYRLDRGPKDKLSSYKLLRDKNGQIIRSTNVMDVISQVEDALPTMDGIKFTERGEKTQREKLRWKIIALIRARGIRCGSYSDSASRYITVKGDMRDQIAKDIESIGGTISPHSWTKETFYIGTISINISYMDPDATWINSNLKHPLAGKTAIEVY